MNSTDEKLISDLRAAAQYLHDRTPNPTKPPETSLYMRAAKRIEELALKSVTKPEKVEKSNGKQTPATE